MSQLLADLKSFLDTSVTSWHAVKEIGNRLAACDFIPLNEEEKWQLEAGKKYFFSRGGTLIAFAIPKKKPRRALLFTAHTDSPALKLKPKPSYLSENMVQFGVEVYGAPLLSSWLNRDLLIAGRMVVTDHERKAQERLVLLDDLTVCIPQLAIHLDREVNEKGLILNKQEHLCPIIGLEAPKANVEGVLEQLLRRHYKFRSLLSFELFLVAREPASFIGINNEMLASSRLDNLLSSHALLAAFTSDFLETKEMLPLALFWEHEEIGSGSKEGANSPLLLDTLQRIAHALKMDSEAEILLRNHSLCVSIDMAHAHHPNYPNKLDPQHKTLLGGGIAIKHNANQKYATNALSSAVIIHACQELNLPYQLSVPRSDLPCGSTVGPLIAERCGINTVDIGCPQLSMHSIREIAATKDYLDLVQLLTFLIKESHALSASPE